MKEKTLRESIKEKYYTVERKIEDIEIVVLYISFVLDLATSNRYSCPINNIYAKAAATVPITVVVWTFTASIAVIFLNIKNNYLYGIPLGNLIEKKMGNKKIIFRVLFFWGELALLYVATCIPYGQWPFMIIGIGVIQMINMLYAIAMVYIETDSNILYEVMNDELVILEDYGKLDYTILFEIIHKMKHLKDDEVERMITILLKLEFVNCKSNKKRIISRLIVNEILMIQNDDKYDVILEWFRRCEDLELRKGMLFAMLVGDPVKNQWKNMVVLEGITNRMELKQWIYQCFEKLKDEYPYEYFVCSQEIVDYNVYSENDEDKKFILIQEVEQDYATFK